MSNRWFTNTLVWSPQLSEQAYRFTCQSCGEYTDRPSRQGYSPPTFCPTCRASQPPEDDRNEQQIEANRPWYDRF